MILHFFVFLSCRLDYWEKYHWCLCIIECFLVRSSRQRQLWWSSVPVLLPLHCAAYGGLWPPTGCQLWKVPALLPSLASPNERGSGLGGTRGAAKWQDEVLQEPGASRWVFAPGFAPGQMPARGGGSSCVGRQGHGWWLAGCSLPGTPPVLRHGLGHPRALGEAPDKVCWSPKKDKCLVPQHGAFSLPLQCDSMIYF